VAGPSEPSNGPGAFGAARLGPLDARGFVHRLSATAESIPRLSTQQLIQFGPADVHWDELTGRR
jgi:hypothetical protein